MRIKEHIWRKKEIGEYVDKKMSPDLIFELSWAPRKFRQLLCVFISCLYVPARRSWIKPEVGKVTLKIRGDEALSDESL